MADKAVSTTDTAKTREGAAEALERIEVALKKLVARGDERGYVTYDELIAALPQAQVSDEQQVGFTMWMLDGLGIDLATAKVRRDSLDRVVPGRGKTFAWAADRLLRTADQVLAETRRGRKETAELLDRLEARLASHG